MEVAAKRPPEKVMLLREPPPAAAAGDRSRPALRPPVPPPKPIVDSALATVAANGQLPPSLAPDHQKAMLPLPPPPPPPPALIPVVDGPSAVTADEVDAPLFDSLPPPPPEDDLLFAAVSVTTITKEEPLLPATSAAAAIERIASKYDTSANAIRTRQTLKEQQQELPATAAVADEPSPSSPGNGAGSAPWQQSSQPIASGTSATAEGRSTGSVREARAAVERAFASRAPSFALPAVTLSAAVVDGKQQQAASLSTEASPFAASALPPLLAAAATPADSAREVSDLSVLTPPPSFAGGSEAAKHTDGSAALGTPAAAIRCETGGSDQRSRASSVDSLPPSGSATGALGVGGLQQRVDDGSPSTPKIAAGKTLSAAAVAAAAHSASSSRSGTPPVAHGNSNGDENDDGSGLPVVPTETVAVKLTRPKIENKRNKTVPRHDHVSDSKKVSFLVAEKSSGADSDRRSSASVVASNAAAQPPMDEKRLRTGLSADEVSQAEVFYRSHKTEVRACQCMATLFFADAPPAAANGGGSSSAAGGVSVDDWKPAHIGIPVLVYDSGEGKRSRALSFVFAERGTGFQLWRNTMHWQTDYRAVEPTFHQMRAGPPLATGGRKSGKSADAAAARAAALASTSMAGMAFQDGESAEQFMAHYRQLVEWRPDDNILGDPSLKKKKKKVGSADKRAKQQPLPSKTAISQPVEFAHITQLKRSEDGAVLPTVLPSSTPRADDLPGKAIS